MLRLLIACGEKAIEAFRTGPNPPGRDFLAELDRTISRAREELAALTER